MYIFLISTVSGVRATLRAISIISLPSPVKSWAIHAGTKRFMRKIYLLRPDPKRLSSFDHNICVHIQIYYTEQSLRKFITGTFTNGIELV